MGKHQCQVPPSTPPSPPFTKGPQLRVILSYQLLNIYLRPHIIFTVETVAIKRTDEINLLWYKQVFSGLKNSMFMGVRYNRLSRSVTHGSYPDLNS